MQYKPMKITATLTGTLLLPTQTERSPQTWLENLGKMPDFWPWLIHTVNPLPAKRSLWISVHAVEEIFCIIPH